MMLLLATLGLLCVGGLAALLLGRRFLACQVVAVCSGVACCLGFISAANILYTGSTVQTVLPFPLPLGACALLIDPFSAFFLLPVFLIGGVASAMLCNRMRMFNGAVHYGRHGFFFASLLGGLVLVLTAADAVFFLLSWECMSLAPFFLLAAKDDDSSERYSAWIYLVAAHLGAFPLLLLFAQMSQECGSSLFADLFQHKDWLNPGMLFIFALLGFGVKLGLFPLHVWMPETYPAAPGHVAPILSGAMVNVGLYGLLRVLGMLGTPEVWWGVVLMVVGMCSGIFGILFALGQSDIKRSLAYSSSENMGIICLALGGGMYAALLGAPVAMMCFFAGALLHIWSHALIKSLLQFGASSVLHATGSANMNMLGGLQKRMPVTSGCMLYGYAALAGFPPGNTFMSELLLFMGFVIGAQVTVGTESTLLFWIGLFCLGAIGGFSLFNFARLYGLTFLGLARSSGASDAQEKPIAYWTLSMIVLTAAAVAVCLAVPYVLVLLRPLLEGLVISLGLPVMVTGMVFDLPLHVLQYAAIASAVCLLVAAILAAVRWWKVRNYPVRRALTWDCGYLVPTARIQYSAGSFSQFAMQVMRLIVRPHVKLPQWSSYFPQRAVAEVSVPDWMQHVFHTLLFTPVARVADVVKDVQHGIMNAYVLYVLVALLTALVWALESS